MSSTGEVFYFFKVLEVASGLSHQCQRVLAAEIISFTVCCLSVLMPFLSFDAVGPFSIRPDKAAHTS